MIGGGFLESRELIGELITADARDVVMVENASMGMNAALRCLQPPLARGDKVIYLSTEYGMTHSVLNYLESTVGIVLVQVDMVPTGYQSDAAVMAAVESAIAEHGGARAFAMGVISHISSQPAVVLPVARFCAALSGVPVVVDGAHAPGTIHLDVPSLGAAAYTGNLHKWMCVRQYKCLFVVPVTLQALRTETRSSEQVHSKRVWVLVDTCRFPAKNPADSFKLRIWRRLPPRYGAREAVCRAARIHLHRDTGLHELGGRARCL